MRLAAEKNAKECFAREKFNAFLISFEAKEINKFGDSRELREFCALLSLCLLMAFFC